MNKDILDEPDKEFDGAGIFYIIARIVFNILILLTIYDRIGILMEPDLHEYELDFYFWFKIILDLSIIYYIGRHILHEMNGGVKPLFKMEIIRLFLILIIFKFIAYIVTLLFASSFLTTYDICFTGIMLVCSIIVFKREFYYFGTLRKLENPEN